MPGPVPGIVNTKMAKTWSLTAEVQSHEEDMQTEGLVERRECVLEAASWRRWH